MRPVAGPRPRSKVAKNVLPAPAGTHPEESRSTFSAQIPQNSVANAGRQNRHRTIFVTFARAGVNPADTFGDFARQGRLRSGRQV